MEITSCAEDIDLSCYGIRAGKCVDDELIEKTFGIDVSHKKDPSQRKKFRGKPEATLFGRRISKKTVSQATIVLLTYISFATVGLLLVVNFQEGQVPHSKSGGIFLDAFFEVFSALATVGFSADFTSHLTEPSRWVIMCLMFAGRIGPLAVVMALSRPMRESDVELEDANLLIG